MTATKKKEEEQLTPRQQAYAVIQYMVAQRLTERHPEAESQYVGEVAAVIVSGSYNKEDKPFVVTLKREDFES